MTSTLHPYPTPWLGDVPGVGAGFKPAPTENERGSPKRRRRSIRLRDYDYSTPGAYFVTICTRNRACMLGYAANGEMRLSEAGQAAQAVWEKLPRHYPHVQLDAWVIMPNHVHGIIVLLAGADVDACGGSVEAGFKPAPTNAPTPANADSGAARHGLPEVVRAFKTFSARRINDLTGARGVPFWQRSYYEHVIRDKASLDRIRPVHYGQPGALG